MLAEFINLHRAELAAQHSGDSLLSVQLVAIAIEDAIARGAHELKFIITPQGTSVIYSVGNQNIPIGDFGGAFGSALEYRTRVMVDAVDQKSDVASARSATLVNGNLTELRVSIDKSLDTTIRIALPTK